MARAMEVLDVDSGNILVRQGQEADHFFVLQSGKVSSKLVPEAKTNDNSTISAIKAIETWDDPGIILGAESVLAGKYIEALVTSEPSRLLSIPATRDDLKKQLFANPKAGLGLARSLARRVVESNRVAGPGGASSKTVSQLERIYTDFVSIVNNIANDAEGDDTVMGALRDAKGSKTYSTGQRAGGDDHGPGTSATRVVESHEMMGNSHKLKKGEALCRKGDPGTAMYIVTKGKLAAVIDGDKVAEYTDGKPVGEIAILLGTNQPRTADIIAEESTTVSIIPGDQFNKLALVQPSLLDVVFNSLMRSITNNYATISDREAKERKAIIKYIGRPDADPEVDYRALAKQLDRLIEEYELTDLLRAYDQLERGADRIAELKRQYASVIAKGA